MNMAKQCTPELRGRLDTRDLAARLAVTINEFCQKSPDRWAIVNDAFARACHELEPQARAALEESGCATFEEVRNKR